MDAPPNDHLVAPFLTGQKARRGQRMLERRWEGYVTPKPWERKVTATFAHLETPELVPVVVDLLRSQTVDPHVIVVDTGSSWATLERLEAEVREPEVELHYIRSHSYRHPSAPVSAACDLAMTLCSSEYLFFTHVDAFLNRPDFLADLISQCNAKTPVVGYRMSDRTFQGTVDWKWMVSHTATMVHMPTVRKIGATWAIEAAHDLYGTKWPKKVGGWPDTETAFNLALKRAGITPKFIGDETNYECHRDANLVHARSFPGSALYSEEYHQQAKRWIDVELEAGRARAERWKRGIPDPRPGDDPIPEASRTVFPATVTSRPAFLREFIANVSADDGEAVTIEQGGALVPLYRDGSGGRLAANPVLASEGKVRAFAGRGTFRLSYRDRTGRGVTTTINNR